MGLVSFKSGGGVITSGYKPSSVTNLTIKRSQKTAALTWTDPEDFTIDDTPCVWARTILIRKAGSAPQSIHDGTEIAVITERNKHTESPWVDGVLELDVTYYYAAYAVSTDGLISDLSNIVSIMIPTSKTMTVVLDLNDSNPATCGSFEDDAISMPYGKTKEAITAWQEFFGYRPCLFKDGKVVGYLNPNDYSKFEDGKSADIRSGNAGDVMVEFPRRGVRINKSGRVVTVTMTDDPDDPDFTYYAHTRGESKRDYFYLSAYYNTSEDVIRSVSGINIRSFFENQTTFREWAHAKGAGYELMTWYQFMYLQVMYVLEFKGNLDSQKTLGIGVYFSSSGDHTGESITGEGNTKGLLCNSEEGGILKIFGIEDLWGTKMSITLDGILIDSSYRVWTATDNFNNDHTGYTKQVTAKFMNEYITNVYGTSELGFFPIPDSKVSGSNTTYFAHNGAISAPKSNNYGISVGGDVDYNETGIFKINTADVTDGNSFFNIRLSYY